MMKKNMWWAGLFLFLLAACSPDADAENTLNLNNLEGNDPETKEEKVESRGDKMQLTIEESSYPFTAKDYPILFQYVRNFNQPEEHLHSLPFSKVKDDQYVVEFACHEQRCSHLMIDFEKKHSFLISDLSQLISTTVSSDQLYAAFLFERTYEEKAKHQLVVMDLATLEPIDLEHGDGPLLPKPNQYQYAIDSVTFVEEERLQLISDDPMASPGTEHPVETQWIYK